LAHGDQALANWHNLHESVHETAKDVQHAQHKHLDETLQKDWQLNNGNDWK
jgi:hypothetical protein